LIYYLNQEDLERALNQPIKLGTDTLSNLK